MKGERDYDPDFRGQCEGQQQKYCPAVRSSTIAGLSHHLVVTKYSLEGVTKRNEISV